MGTYTGGVGSSGQNLGNGVYDTGIQLGSGEYPTHITFDVKAGGAYWTNRLTNKTATATTYLAGSSDGTPSVQLQTWSLQGGKSNTTVRDYDIDGSSLAGCRLYLWIDTARGFALRNYCAITVETSGSAETAESAAAEPITSPDVYKRLLPTVNQDDKLIGYARRSTWTVKVDGVDITEEVKKDLISIDITDNEEDEADDLQIKLADREAIWLQKWLNETVHKGAKSKGLTFTVWIGTQTHTGKVSQQKTGSFYLDCMKHKGPPAVVTIKCTSCDFEGGIRTDKHDKSWENYNLRGIASEIANNGNLKLLYCTQINPTFQRKEQSGETDIAFLIRICDDYGLSIKVTSGMLVVFNRRELENEDLIGTVTYGDGTYTSWDLSTTSGDVTYDYCTVKYTDPYTGKCITGTYYSDAYQDEEDRVAEANSGKSGDDLETADHQEFVVHNKKVSSIAEAEALAEVELNLKNLFERTVTLTIPGNPAMMAGLPIGLKDFGYWSGKYMISQVVHSISKSAYTTKLKLRFVGRDDVNDRR